VERDLIDLTGALVAADSVNPSLVPGGAGEAAAARIVAGWARAAGLAVDLHERTPGRPSAVVRAPGTGGGRTLLLCGHLDTVGVAGMTDAPHAPRVDAGRLHGRGAYDMKGGLAAALIACRSAARARLRGDVVVAAVADEEHASIGVQEVLETVTADGAIVTEPTELEVVVAHKGFVWLEVAVAGTAAHGSRPHLGVDAIAKAGPVLTALGALDARLAGRPAHPLLGRASVHASTIAGGTELSSYPAACTIGIERRTLPGETPDGVEAELAALLAACRAADPALDATARTLLVRAPLETDPEHELVAALRGAAAETTGAEPPVGGASYWADAAFIAAAGIPTAMYGPAGAGAHAAEEWVDVASLAAVAATLTATATAFCR